MPMTLNPSMKTLILKHNNFHSVDASFQFYQELEYVDLSSNHLVSIPDRSFSNQRKLLELIISGNKISKLGEKTFDGLSSLEVLNLADNIISKLRNRSFKSMILLKELSLRGNKISEIRERAFAGLSDLTLLDLSDNELQDIPSNAFNHLSNLVELLLAKNNVMHLNEHTLLNSKLSLLDLSGNVINEIHRNAFQNIKHLKHLYLQDNNMNVLPSSCLTHFERLQVLHIGQNKFNRISDGAFSSLTRLITLDISGCSELQEVSQDAFSQLEDLESVKISWNRKLTYIHENAFSLVPNMRYLDLSNNGLMSVSRDLVPWMSLTSVDLSGNPWHCDCEINFMKDVIIHTVNSSDNIPIVRCQSPSNIKGKDVALLNIECEVVLSANSPNRYDSKDTIDFTAIYATLCSSLIVISVVIVFAILKSKDAVTKCLIRYRHRPEKKEEPYRDHNFLQYPENSEPRYVYHQQTLRPVITANPLPQALVKSDQYFIIQESQPNKKTIKHQEAKQHHNFYKDDFREEQIYQLIEDN